MKKCGVYKIQNKVNNKLYVGSSVNIKGRWADHIKMLTNNRHHNKHLQSSFNKHGIENFEFIILEECCKENLIQIEQQFINSLQPKYNILKIAGSRLGQKHTEETKEKLRLKNIGRKHTDEAKNKISEAGKGKQHFFGHKHSDEAKKKQSEASKGNSYSLGNKHTEEAKKKISKASKGNKVNLGRFPSEETKKKMSETRKGRKHSPETKAKIAEKARLQHIRQNEAKKLLKP